MDGFVFIQTMKDGKKTFVLHAGFNPVWNQTLNFVIHTTDLALIRFVVEDYDKTSKNDFIGQYTLPFTCIQPGEQRVTFLWKK